MAGEVVQADCFTCPIDLPVRIAGTDLYRYRPVIVVFRGVPGEVVNAWLMPRGEPRSDRDLASDVVVTIRSPRPEDDRASNEELAVPSVLEMDRAAALVVSTFLSLLPQTDDAAMPRKTPARRRTKAVETSWALLSWAGVG